MIERRKVLAGLGAACLPWPVTAAPAGELRVAGDRLFVPARINGVASEALLDSAAEMTLVSPRFAARAGIAGGDSVTARGSGASTVPARLAENVRLSVAGQDLVAVVAVIDLDDIGTRLLGRPIDVIIGREIFDTVPLVIDIDAGRFHVARHLPAGPALPLTSAHGTERLPVTVEGHPALAEFDLGNGSGLLVSRGFAVRAGLLDGRPTGMVSGGGLGGARPRQTLVIGEIAIAGRRFQGVAANLDDSDNAAEANIGVGLLRHFRITADFRVHRLWLAEKRDDGS